MFKTVTDKNDISHCLMLEWCYFLTNEYKEDETGGATGIGL